MTPTPPLPSEDADVAAVRKAHVHREHGGRLNFIQDCATCAALDRLTKRMQQLEIALKGERSGARIDFERAEAAESREAALREALRVIAGEMHDTPSVWLSEYRFKGGGYEGLQAVARAALYGHVGADPEASE